MMRDPLRVICQRGLGDNIFARPFIRAAAMRNQLYLDTPWPELYEDLPVQFFRPDTRLRTQLKNVMTQPHERWSPVRPMPEVKLTYGHNALRIHRTISRAIEQALPLHGSEYLFDLPNMGSPPFWFPKMAVIRPVTLRSEWQHESRNPDPRYVNQIARALMKTHYTILVADLEEGKEWAEGPLPPAHRLLVRGELHVDQMLELVRRADVVVGGVGWIVPATIAAGTKCFILQGGCGAHNAPHVITDERMDLSNIYFAQPGDFCKCANSKHKCNKRIQNLPGHWDTFATSHGLPSAQALGLTG